MPLPTIETPTYELKVPSSGKKIKYRPFLVKEEKILIIALESKDQNEITNAVKDVLKKCILTRGVNVDDFPTFDIEYIFLNIRAKSIGEDIKITVTCPDDGETQVPVTVYVDEIKVIRPEGHKNDIVIDEESKDYLLSISQYSIRVLINFLEKMHIYDEPINIHICKDICSTISFHLFEKYLIHLKEKNIQDAISLLNHIHSQGYSVIDILDYFFFFVKHTDLINEKLKYQIIPYLCKYITVFHNIHEDQIELALFTNNVMKLF